MRRVAVLADNTDDYRPAPEALAKGELVLNDSVFSTGLYYKTEAEKVIKVGPCHIGKDAPNINPPVISSFSGFKAYKGWCEGEFWLDNSEHRPTLKIYDGVKWVVINPPLTELFNELDTVFPNRVVCESVLQVKSYIFVEKPIDISQNDNMVSTTKFVQDLVAYKIEKEREELKKELTEGLTEKLREELKKELTEELIEKLRKELTEELKEELKEEVGVKKTVEKRGRKNLGKDVASNVEVGTDDR